MDNQILKKADTLLKQGDYKSAWDLLIPFKDEADARKRLKWIKAKRDQLKTGNAIVPKPKKKFGWRMRFLLATVGICSGCIAFTLLGQVVGILPDGPEMTQTRVAQIAETSVIETLNAPTSTGTATNTASPTATATATSTNTPNPSETATSTATASNTPTATATATITNTPTITPSSTITNTPAPTATFTPVPPTATPDTIRDDTTHIQNAIRGATDFHINSVQIADNRATGGERLLMVTYRSEAFTGPEISAEWGQIFWSTGGAIMLYEIDLDYLVVIVGNQSDITIGTVGVNISDILAYLNDQITIEQFFSRLVVTDF